MSIENLKILVILAEIHQVLDKVKETKTPLTKHIASLSRTEMKCIFLTTPQDA